MSGGTEDGVSGEQAAAASPAYTILIRFELDDYSSAAASCKGQGGYGDIGAGTPVKLTDQSGTILGAKSLGAGTRNGSACTWDVTMPGIPTGRSFYSVEIASRGQITKGEDELKSDSYSFTVSLG